MSFFSNIIKRRSAFELNKRLKKLVRNPEFLNFSNSKNVGLVFDATNIETYEAVKRYVKVLKDRGLELTALGFVNQKAMPDSYRIDLCFKFFSKKELNWYKKPKSKDVRDFMGSEFDILIDLSIEEEFPVKYIVALSKAHFKVGSHKLSNNYCDFMIDLGNQANLSNLTKQVDNYLEMIQ